MTQRSKRGLVACAGGCTHPARPARGTEKEACESTRARKWTAGFLCYTTKNISEESLCARGRACVHACAKHASARAARARAKKMQTERCCTSMTADRRSSADQMVSDMSSSAGTPLPQSILARRMRDVRAIKFYSRICGAERFKCVPFN